MVSTVSVLTLRLAEAIGLYWIAAGLFLLIHPHRLGTMLDDNERSPALALLTGLVAFAIGAAMLIGHHGAPDPLATVVTLVAAIVAIEGLVLIAFPGVLPRIGRAFVSTARIWGVVALILGLVMLLAGLTGRADYLPQGLR
jgi:hypothetical protein